MTPETSPGAELVDHSLQDLRADPSVGLCSVCAHSRVTGNRRGSIFWLCRRSTDDARFRRYPRLPVARCPGFEPAAPGRADDDGKHQERQARRGKDATTKPNRENRK